MDGELAIARNQIAAAVNPGTAGDVSPRERRLRLTRLFVVSAIVISAGIVLGTAAIVSSLRTHALAEAQVRVASIALMLGEQTDRSLQAGELLQKNLFGRMRGLGITSTADMEQRLAGYDAHVLLKDTISGLPFVGSVALIGAKGDIVNSSRQWPLVPANVADRDYYKALASDPQLASFLSAPVLNRVDRSRGLFLARKFVGPNNEFVGLAVVGLELQSFEEQFRSVALGDGVEIGFVRTDGMLLARYPRLAGDVERKDDRGPLFETAAAAPQDNDARVSAVHGLAHFPARISASVPISAALAYWRTEALYLAGAAALVVLMIGGIAWFAVCAFGSYALMVKDRAQRLQAQAAQHATEFVKQQLDAAVDNMPQGLVMFDGAARLVVCNRRYIEMYGLSREVAGPGCKLRDIIADRIQRGGLAADADDLAAKVQELVRIGQPWKTTSELKTGRTIDILTFPIEGGGWVATHEDVTERCRAERQHKRTEKFLASVIENVPTTITVKDAINLRYILINKAGERYFGLRRSEIIGKTAYDLFPPASAEMIASHDRQLLGSKMAEITCEHEINTPAGQHRIVSARRMRIQDEDGKPQYLLSLIDDITDRSRAKPAQ